MRTSFHPRLINSPFSDPGLLLSFLFQKRAILFDLGDLGGLTARDLLKVSHVFVSHTHMDHFSGFDALLRIVLGRDREIHLFGPSGFFSNVEGKLAGYTWNLVHDYPYNLRIKVTEVTLDTMRTRVYHCRDRFRPEPETEEKTFSGVLMVEPHFRMEAVLLDHRIPCLGLSLVENYYVNIIKEELDNLGLSTGPWLTRFKKAIYEKRDPDSEFIVTWEQGGAVIKQRGFRFGTLAEKIARISPGQKISYITDVSGSSENKCRILGLIKNSDRLFIEAAFLDRDRDLARKKNHLTAKEAGELAKEAGVRFFTLFHFSPRYTDRPDELQREATEAFQGAVSK